MNTLQVNGVLTKHVKDFQGIYPIGFLPITLIWPSIIVINFDKHYMPGSHWVAACFSDSGYAEYFDTYCLQQYKLEIMSYLHRHSISLTFNRHGLQGLTSEACDHYCYIYTLHRPKGLSTTSFVNMCLPARYNCNDIKAICMFRAQFVECPSCSHLEQQQQS